MYMVMGMLTKMFRETPYENQLQSILNRCNYMYSNSMVTTSVIWELSQLKNGARLFHELYIGTFRKSIFIIYIGKINVSKSDLKLTTSNGYSPQRQVVRCSVRTDRFVGSKNLWAKREDFFWKYKNVSNV